MEICSKKRFLSDWPRTSKSFRKVTRRLWTRRSHRSHTFNRALGNGDASVLPRSDNRANKDFEKFYNKLLNLSNLLCYTKMIKYNL